MSRCVLRVSLSLVLALFASAATAANCPATNTLLVNGTTADAGPVNGNFANLLDCANNYLAPLASPSFTGNVGIGTATPQRLLHLYAANPEISIESTGISSSSVGRVWGFYNGAGTLYIRALPADFSSSNNVLTLLNTGYIGIGTTTPGYLLTVNGTAYAAAFTTTSDRRHKQDIAPFAEDALAAILKLRPVTFQWKDARDDGMRGRQIGFIAQDVLPVLPDAVLTMANAEHTLGLKYDSFIPVLTKAIQEQQAQIVALQSADRARTAEIRELRDQIAALQRVTRQRTAAR